MRRHVLHYLESFQTFERKKIYVDRIQDIEEKRRGWLNSILNKMAALSLTAEEARNILSLIDSIIKVVDAGCRKGVNTQNPAEGNIVSEQSMFQPVGLVITKEDVLELKHAN